jgi:hypothetical protein
MWCFGDSFDLYTAIAETAAGYWDTLASTPAFVTGRFSGGRAISFSSTGQSLTKASGANDAVHHLTVAFQQTAALSGTTLGGYLELFDGATAQCSIVFRSDGAILLTSGGPAGTALATYTGAVTLQNQWFAFEFEVVINNITGSFKVRTNNATSDSFSATGLNTRGGTANNYANKLQLGEQQTINAHLFDDILWRSDPSSVPWLGDIRCYARMPASDAAVQFSRLGGATNFSQVSEAHQDGATSYVFDNVVSHNDLYGIASIPVTPASVVAVTTRGFAQKSDAGSRTGAIQLKSGGTTVQSTNGSTLSTTFAWVWRADQTDPATGAAWTPTAVNNLQIGPVVVS